MVCNAKAKALAYLKLAGRSGWRKKQILRFAQDDNICGIDIDQAGARLAVLIFPVALFVFCYPFDGLSYAFVAGFWPFGFCDPFDVFAFAAGAEGCEYCGGFLVGLEGLGEFGWCF